MMQGRSCRQIWPMLAQLAAAMAFVVMVHVDLAQSGNPREFKELLAIASKLESSEMLPSIKTEELSKQKSGLQYQFAREPKREPCLKQYEQLVSKIHEFRLKAHQFVDENKYGGRKWFQSMLGSPMGSMKGLGRFDGRLAELADHYDKWARKETLTHDEVDCDMIRFQVRGMHSIMFVLQTDLKQLITGEQPLLNKAIYEQLLADRLVSEVNYYDVHELNEEQKNLLLSFYTQRGDIGASSIGTALDHFHKPGQYIIGRIMDTCQAVLRLAEEWSVHELLDSSDGSCARTSSDPMSERFKALFKANTFEDIFELCRGFFDAL